MACYFVYILYSPTFDKYYIGQTNDISDRLRRHNEGYEHYTKAYIPWEIACVIEKETRLEAMVLEKKLKNLNKHRLQEFIKKYG
jgi:putative endonuclease